MSSRRQYNFDNVDLFEDLVKKITEFTRGRSKSLKNVMKTLSYLQFVKGLPGLNEAFTFLKVFVFELYKSEGIKNQNASALHSSSHNTNSKVLNKTTYKELDIKRCLLETAVKHHINLIRELQKLQKKCLMYEEKEKKCKEKLQMKLEQPESEKKKGTEKEIKSLQKKLSLKEEFTDLAYISYQTTLEMEKCARHEMMQLSEALHQQVVEMARDKLARSFEVLEDLAWSNKLSMFILEKIKIIDSEYAIEELYKHMCKAYVFPDPEEWNSRNGFHVELQDPALLSSDYCLNKGEVLRLVDVEEPDKDLEIMPGEIYVEAVTKCKKENGSSLTFNRGKIFKQKLTSEDGKIGFGWKRCRTGIKVFGFYSTCMVKFNHIPKK